MNLLLSNLCSLLFFLDCPENSASLPFHCKYVQGQLAAYFDPTSDDDTMINYASVIINRLSIGMEVDAFVDDNAKLLLYIPPPPVQPEQITPVLLDHPKDGEQDQTTVPTIVTSATSADTALRSEESSNSIPSIGYIAVGVGCLVAIVLALLLTVYIKQRRSRKVDKEGNSEFQQNRSNFDVRIDDAGTINDNYCIEVEVSDHHSVAMSATKDGHVEKMKRVSNNNNSQQTATTVDECATIASQESGVTLYLDRRTTSDISELTWYTLSQSGSPLSSLGKGLAGLPEMGAIDEEEDAKEEEESLTYSNTESDRIEARASKESLSKSNDETARGVKGDTSRDSLCYSSSG